MNTYIAVFKGFASPEENPLKTMCGDFEDLKQKEMIVNSFRITIRYGESKRTCIKIILCMFLSWGGPFDTWGGYGFSFVIKLSFRLPA